MTKLIFNTIAVFLTWILGHVFLYIYLNRLLPYATINLFTAVLWLAIIVFSHYKWSYFMGGKIYSIYVGMDDAKGHL
jgi:hypothetical protein